MTRPAADPPPAVGLPAEVREPARASNAAPSVQPADATAAVPTNGGQVRISQRVVFHIAAQGRIGPDEVAPRPLSQAGIGEALQVSQGALTGVLRRLVAAGVLEEKRQHVRGIDRRVKVYRLTPSGQQLYRELRRGTPPTDVTIRIPTRPRPARSVGAANPSPSVE